MFAESSYFQAAVYISKKKCFVYRGRKRNGWNTTALPLHA